ncbi:MAG TPA: hypothetical protein ENK31_08840 [Nannocystis exedens]|nr:hypothetical protein [Nannocystis exedens]
MHIGPVVDDEPVLVPVSESVTPIVVVPAVEVLVVEVLPSVVPELLPSVDPSDSEPVGEVVGEVLDEVVGELVAVVVPLSEVELEAVSELEAVVALSSLVQALAPRARSTLSKEPVRLAGRFISRAFMGEW